ncbi:MAG: hypothetical protein RL065_1082 [Bacteroidota bacterium]
MENEYPNNSPKKNLVTEPITIFQKQDADNNHQLEEALKRTDMEKFQYLMKLVKTQRMMQKMSISHKP